MKIRFIDEIDINGVQGHTNKFDNASYVGILLRLKADNDVNGTDVDEDDAPRIRVNFRGDDIVNCLWSNLRKFCDLEYGKPENAVAGVTWQGGIIIPFYHPKLANAIHKRVGDNMDLYSETFGAACANTCKLQVYGILDDIPEIYVPKLIDYLETAVVGQIKIVLQQDNLAQIMLTKPATTPQTLIELLVDNSLLYASDWHNLQNLANLHARIEATALEVIVFNMVTKGQVNESLSDRAQLLSTGGSGNFYYMVQSLSFHPAITLATSQMVMDLINYRLKEKAVTGKIAGTIITNLVNPRLVKTSTKKVIGDRPEYSVVRQELSKAKTRSIVP